MLPISVKVKFLTGETHAVVCTPNETVWDFKVKLGRQTGVSPYQQRLTRQGGSCEDLQNGVPLANYRLGTDDTLLLMVKNEESIQVLLMKSGQGTRSYQVLPSDTVARFRSQIRMQEGIQDDQFWLVYGSQTLENGRKISDYYICPGGTITLNLRLRGG